MKKNTSGFTLIELLIVIALLGALAVGLLATVDPFEQLKKGTDTSRRNTASEVYNAFIRYYSVKSQFPFTADLTGTNMANDTFTADSSGYLSMVIAAGELKPEFIQLAGSGALEKINITSTGGSVTARQNITVCFQPESKSFQNETNTKYNSSGEVGTNCPGTGGVGGSCYWCIK